MKEPLQATNKDTLQGTSESPSGIPTEVWATTLTRAQSL